MINFSLEQGSSITTMLAVAAVAIFLTGIFYRRAFGMLKPRHWLMLFALRVAAIVLIVLLIFRPIFSYQKELTNRPSLVFLLDRSASMSIADDATGVTRFNQARMQIEKWWAKLKNNFDLHLIAFAENAQLLKDIKDLDSISPDGKATSLSRALAAASQLVPRRRSRGDSYAFRRHPQFCPQSVGRGRQTGRGRAYGGRRGQLAEQRFLSRHSGDRRRLPRSLVSEQYGPDYRLDRRHRAGGPSGPGRVGGGRAKNRRKRTDNSSRRDSAASFVRFSSDGQRPAYLYGQSAAGGRRKNHAKQPAVGHGVGGRAGHSRVVYRRHIAGGIRRLVDRFLAKDPDLEFYALVQTRPNVFLKRTNMSDLKLDVIPNDAETINKFDVFIFGDIDSSLHQTASSRNYSLKRVREGAGLVMLGGYHSLGPGGYAGTPLGRILPVTLGSREIGQITEPFLPVLTPEGARHPIFANIADFFPTQQGKPKMPGCRCWTAAPGGRTAAGRVAFGHTFRRIGRHADLGRPAGRQRPHGRLHRRHDAEMAARSQGAGSGIAFLRFWGQMVRWLAGRAEAVEAKSGIVASLDKGYYEPEEPVRISAIVRDKDGQGTNDAKVTVKIQGPAGQSEQVALSPQPGPAGHYGGTFDPKAAGNYEFTVEARLGELSLIGRKNRLRSRPAESGIRETRSRRENARPHRRRHQRPLLPHHHGRSAFEPTRSIAAQTQRNTSNARYIPPAVLDAIRGVLTAEWVLRRKISTAIERMI